MAMAVEVIVDTKAFHRLEIELKKIPKEMPGAMASALNRTLDYTATQISRIVSEEYVISKKDVKSTLKKKKASKSSLDAYITSKGRTLTLYHHFKVNPRYRGKKKYQIKVQVKRTGGKQPLSGDPKPFLPKAGAPKSKQQVFQRVGPERKPLVVLRSLSVPQMISNEGNLEKIQKLANDKLEERLAHEIKWRLEKAAAKGRV